MITRFSCKVRCAALALMHVLGMRIPGKKAPITINSRYLNRKKIKGNTGIPYRLQKKPLQIGKVKSIDTSSIYTLVPQIETYPSEIVNQIRRVRDDPDAVDNPIGVLFPNLRVNIEI